MSENRSPEYEHQPQNPAPNQNESHHPYSEHAPAGYPASHGQAPQTGYHQFEARPVQHLSEDVRSTAGLSVILGLLGWLPPLIFWLMYKDKPGYEFVRANAAATFNFTLLLSIIYLVLSFIPFIGWVVVLGMLIWQIVSLVSGFSTAKEGRVASFALKIPVLS